MPRSSTSLIPRLAAEFVVIVVGVLVALGVDSWSNDRADRVLEREYLQRLLDDVRYDMGGWPTQDLRRDVLTADAQGGILLSTHRFQAGLNVTGQLRGMGVELAAALERALADLTA